jgi:hypothetical protein
MVHIKTAVYSETDHGFRFVFYEELTARPEATLERLLAELGLEWEPDILECYTHTARRLVTFRSFKDRHAQRFFEGQRIREFQRLTSTLRQAVA